MTVTNLWSYALKSVKAVTPTNFTDLNGKTIGIDISVFLHRVCASETVALCMLCQPRYPPTNVILVLKSWHNALTSNGIKPYYVFDGHIHPMKSVARQKRDSDKQKSLNWLEQLYAKGRTLLSEVTEEEREEMMQHLNKVTVPDTHLVSYVVHWMNNQEIYNLNAPLLKLNGSLLTWSIKAV